MPEIQSKIIAVTVFPDRARVTRKGSLSIKKGLHRIEFIDLPVSLDPNSVRARARGTARAQFLGLDVRQTFHIDTPSARAHKLEESLRALEMEDQTLADEADTNLKEQAHLDGLIEATRTYAYALSSAKSDLKTHADLLTFYAERRGKILSELRRISHERANLSRELEKIRQELERIRGERPRQRYTISLEYEVVDPGELDVEIIYHVEGCSWSPQYDMRLSDHTLMIQYYGQVIQKSGEDWEQVELTLSTAYPALATVLPELSPWYLDEYQYRPPRGLVMAAAAEPVEPAAAVAGAPAPAQASPSVQEAEAVSAQVSQSGAAVTYRIGGGIDIPGDGSPRKSQVATIRMSPRLDYISAPRLAQAAYRRVMTDNTSEYMLLPGQAQLFEGDDYLGTTRIDLTAPGQEIELYFGADDRVRVEREIIRHDTDRTLVGDRKRTRYAYSIEIENHTGSEQQLTVRDQFPVPRSENIKVRLEACDPKPTRQDDLNRLEWDLKLQEGARHEVKFEFSVEHPRGIPITGVP